jgi:hypothetical protein
MTRRPVRRTVIILLLVVVVFFIGYSYVFRTYADTDKYLQIAWAYTGYDPHVLNWQEPEAEFLFRDGKPLVHMIYHTDQDDLLGPYSFYIDPFKMQVVAEDPRGG